LQSGIRIGYGQVMAVTCHAFVEQMVFQI